MSRIGVKTFISGVEQIAAEEPSYRKGGWGQDGTCDCIGLPIGSIRRAGGSWRGLHGANYAARSEMETFGRIGGAGELEVGELVYKALEPGESGYGLPDRYKPGGACYNGDVRDYCHVGVVVSVHPLRIRHMTTPRPKMDTKIGKWAYHGRLKKIDYSGGGEKKMSEKATVVLPAGSKGSTVNLRDMPGKDGKVLAQVPVGTVVEVQEDLGQWCRIEAQGFDGYMMSNYLEYAGGGEEISGDVITAEEREKIDNALADIENRLELIRSILGRG